MTAEEIDRLEAGPELDMLIADQVMGWRGAGLEGCGGRNALVP
jgi:hypothetical protein